MALKFRRKIRLNFVFYTLVGLCLLVVTVHGFCRHIHPKHDQVLHGVYIEPHHVMKKRSIDQPLRILLWYDESVYRLDAEKFELINNTILPRAVRFWEKALYVRKVEDVILLTRKCNDSNVFVKNNLTHCIDACKDKTMCGEVELPEDHLDACRTCNASAQDCMNTTSAGQGIKGYDFVFYVSAMQTDRCNKSLTVAYAAHCQQEIGFDRPIAGHANLCPKSISTKPQEMETLLSTVKHEILHALGFSVSLFGFYRDNKGNPLTPRRPETGKPALNEKYQTYDWSEKVIKTFERKSWFVRSGVRKRTVQMIVTPTVVQEVRRYFDCEELEGAELEDQGEEGTALTHWEKRVFENEAMTGTHTQNPIISNVTLALMEDTGWYRANYEMAEPMSWGKGLGCDFVMKSCKEWISTKTARGLSIHPFCNKVKRDPLQTECTDDRTSVALCNLVRHDNILPDIYQNFDSLKHVAYGMEGYYGGSVLLADYCPYIQEFTWSSKNVIVRGSHCQYADNNPKPDKNFALEQYGPHSKCFDHTNQMWEERSCKQMRQWQHWGSGCYSYKCNNGRLHIIVANYTYTCYHPFQEISIRILKDGWLHKGAIVCPSCKDMCEVSQELKKIKSKKSGDGADDVYASSWQYFEALKFLTPVLTANETKSSLPGTSRTPTCDVAESQLEETESQAYLENKKRKQKCKGEDNDKVFEQAMKVLLQEPDEYHNFGQYVAMELRGLRSDFNKRKMKHEIRKVILRIVEEDDNLLERSSFSSTPFAPSPALSLQSVNSHDKDVNQHFGVTQQTLQPTQPEDDHSVTCASFLNSFNYTTL